MTINPSPRLPRPAGRGSAVGHHRAAVQGRPGLAPAWLAGVRQVRAGRCGAAGGEPVAAARSGQPGHPDHAARSAMADRSCSRTSASSGPASPTPRCSSARRRSWSRSSRPLLRHSVARPLAWAGFALSLAGVGFIAGGQGSGSSLAGDALVLAAQLISAALHGLAGPAAARARPDRGHRSPAHGGGGRRAADRARDGAPGSRTGQRDGVLATIGLVLAGTVLPTSLFAFGQSRVSADVAGAFLNLEPLVGAIMGMALFAEPAGPVQVAGGAAITVGIGLSSFQVVRSELQRASAPSPEPASRALVPASVRAGGAAPVAGRSATPAPPAPGEAPSLVRRTRLPRPRPLEVARLRRRRLRPAGHPAPRPRRDRNRRGGTRMR